MSFSYMPFKIIHWDLDQPKRTGNVVNVDNSYKASCVVKPQTKIKNGFMIRWTVRVYSEKGVFLSCIAEQVFIHENIALATFEDVKEVLQNAMLNFLTNFKLRADDHHLGIEPYHQVKDVEIQNILNLVKE